MPPINITDLAPTPFFARFLEGHGSDLTAQQMKNIRGGAAASEVTMAAPSDSDAGEVVRPGLPWPDFPQLPWRAGIPGFCGTPVPVFPCYTPGHTPGPAESPVVLL